MNFDCIRRKKWLKYYLFYESKSKNTLKKKKKLTQCENTPRNRMNYFLFQLNEKTRQNYKSQRYSVQYFGLILFLRQFSTKSPNSYSLDHLSES